MLASHLKEIHPNFPLRWALEGMMSHGKFEDRTVTNGMPILGLDYSFSDNTHQFYFEGAFKNVANLSDESLTDDDANGLNKNVGKNNGFGFREAFYRLSLDKTTLTAGLQSMTLGDEVLVDERVLGLSVDQNFGAFDAKFRIGSVDNNFSRMGEFCGSRKIFNLTRKTQAADELWQTNLTSYVLTWNPSYKAPEPVEETSEDGFEDYDEFEDFGEFESFDESKPLLQLKKVGLIAYQEFGEGFSYEKYWYGGFAEFKLPFDTDLKMETLGQSVPHQSAIIYFAELHKNFFWAGTGNFDMKAGYFGKINIDKRALFMSTFSHLYLGEVMRLDGRDIPIAYGSMMYSFPWRVKIHLKATAITQMKNEKISELDFELGILLFNHIKLTPIYSIISSKENDTMTMIRLEARAAI